MPEPLTEATARSLLDALVALSDRLDSYRGLEDDRLISLAEAAAYCGYTEDAFREIVARPRNRPRYFQTQKKGSIKFRKSWLDEWIQENSKGEEPIVAAPVRRKRGWKPSIVSNGMGLDMSLLKIGNRYATKKTDVGF